MKVVPIDNAIPTETIVLIKCVLCYEENKNLSNCGNANCDKLMCDTCIIKLKNLSNDKKELCPFCTLKLSKEILEKQNKDNQSVEKYKCDFYKYCRLCNEISLAIFYIGLLLFLGNELISWWFPNIQLIIDNNSFFSNIICSMIGAIIIIMIGMYVIYILIHLKFFFCKRN